MYRVDSIAYDDNGAQTIDTFYYQYKEEIGEEYTDDAGKQAFIVKRYYRDNDSTEWIPTTNYTVQLVGNTLQKVEDNVRIVKLVFPLRDRLSWDGNMYNNKGDQLFRIIDYKKAYALNNVSVTSLKVQQWNIQNFIEEIKRYEIYADNIGMVELLFDSLNTQDSGTRGFRYRLTLTSYTF